MIGKTNIWRGKEVEGRLKGLPTLFINDITELKGELKEPHIYLCRRAVGQLIKSDNPLKILNLCKNAIITLEVSFEQLELLPAMLRIHCHILLAIEEPLFNLLKPDDEVKFIVGDYHLYSTTKEQMVETKPEDYKNDFEK